MISKNQFYELSALIFKSLNENEQLILNLNAEHSVFMRFSQSKVRQMGEVDQSNLELHLQSDSKYLKSILSLMGNADEQVHRVLKELEDLRHELKTLPVDPHFTPLGSKENSEEIIKGELLGIDEISNTILSPLKDVDAAGMYCSGKVVRASVNSIGARHWFENESFFVDYSLYSAKQQAVKGGYAGSVFNKEQYLLEIQSKRELLAKVSLLPKKIQPGKYRAYFAPAATKELLSTMQWNGFSFKSFKEGQSPLTDLSNGKDLSSKVDIGEDFSLGFSPRFNERGEVFSEKLELFKNGKLENTLVSTRSAREFNTESNFAAASEIPRSLVLGTGNLSQNDILAKLDTGLYISNLHYINWSDLKKGRMTGMTRFACFWVENGKIVAPISDLRFDESFYHFFGDGLEELTSEAQVFPDTDTYEERSLGAIKAPGILVNDFTFTL